MTVGPAALPCNAQVGLLDGEGMPWNKSGGIFFRGTFKAEVLKEYRDLQTGVIGLRQRENAGWSGMIVIRLVKR